jgi:hypothetical protein
LFLLPQLITNFQFHSQVSIFCSLGSILCNQRSNKWKKWLDLSMHCSLVQSFCFFSLLLWLGFSGIPPGLKFYWLVALYMLLKNGLYFFLVQTTLCLCSSVMVWKTFWNTKYDPGICRQWVQNSHKIITHAIRRPCLDSNWARPEHTPRVSPLRLRARLICAVSHL